MPNPSAGESHDDFISRCIKEIMPIETTDEKQAYAICESRWKKNMSNFSIVCKRLGLMDEKK
jgi:hypothetical protein